MRVRLLAAAALAAASVMATGGTSSAACFGTSNTVVLCVNPGALPTVDPTGSSYDDCVWIGDRCEPVSVPIPTVQPGSGDLITCGGSLLTC